MATQDEDFEMVARVANDLMGILVHVVQSSVTMRDTSGKEIGVFISEENWLDIVPQIIHIQNYLNGDMEPEMKERMN